MVASFTQMVVKPPPDLTADLLATFSRDGLSRLLNDVAEDTCA